MTPMSARIASARRLRSRHAADRRFRRLGLAAVVLAGLFLALLFTSIVSKGHGAFWQTRLLLEVNLEPSIIDPAGTRDPQVLGHADYQGLLKAALRERLPELRGRGARRDLYSLLSSGAAYRLREAVLADPGLVGRRLETWFAASADVDMLLKGYMDRGLPARARRLNDRQIGWLDTLAAEGRVEQQFNTAFFTAGDSREPELAGIAGAVVGSFYTLLVTLALAFPIGVASAVYLEEFAPKNRWTDLVEVNVNNLAAVPSIIFGLLGLAVFINVFGLPRSSPLTGGLVLALMTLPTLIIAARATLKSVPPSIRDAARAMGASRVQTVTHHVLPLAMPGMLTGTIIGMAQALGETAPLLMIGMVAFIADVPGGPLDPATVLPVQIYLWADSPERAFVERTAAAILVLLVFLIVMNALAVVLRKRFERRW